MISTGYKNIFTACALNRRQKVMKNLFSFVRRINLVVNIARNYQSFCSVRNNLFFKPDQKGSDLVISVNFVHPVAKMPVRRVNEFQLISSVVIERPE